MKSEKENNMKALILAAVVGGLAGTAIGLMLAPKPGKEMRGELKQKAKETWDNLEITEGGRELIKDIRDFLAYFHDNSPQEPLENKEPRIMTEEQEI